MRISRFKAVAAAAAAATLLLAGCAESERDPDDDAVDTDATFILGTEGEALTLDPTFASDGVTMRVARQIYNTLVVLDPGTTDIVGGLAESWEPNEDGTEWTFQLREGVSFHDGTPFNAEAVCANFDRWHTLDPGIAQDPSMSYYWQLFSGGFAENSEERADLGDPNYVSCQAPDELTAVIELRESTSKMPGLLVLPPFSIHSPAALEQYNADDLGGTSAAPEWSEYALEHPTGTGPFMFESWDRANSEITLVPNPDYWGGAPQVGQLVFRGIPDENARRQALLAGDIDGYDLVSPADWASLEAEGMNLLVRGATNILYLAFTQEGNPALQKLEVRQAIAHALDRQAMVDAVMPEGAEVATQFQPPNLPGWNQDVIKYPYDPDLARELLAEAGEEDLTLRFYWPTEVTRPYMPDPQSIFELFAEDLQAVGITVEEVSLPWSPEYLADVQNGEADAHFLGWTADFADAYNFLGTWFARPLPQWGFDNQAVFDAMAEADAEPDPETRYAMYEELNAQIMEFLPGVPISHTPPALVLAPEVSGVLASPLQQEQYATVQISG